jgi:CO/xanthine dehydrogenase FAD-binding subunit
MKAFELVIARDAAHAVALLAEHGPSVKVLAGGTDLLVELKAASQVPRVLVDISRATDMKGIALADQGLCIGALVTHTEIMRSPLVRELFPALADAAHSIGAVQTRNMGTLGGNLATCVPSMDSGPTLVALDAVVAIAGPGGHRQLPLTGFFAGPRKSVLEPEELLLEIVIPRENLGKPADFQKFGLRKGQALALVNAAASLWMDWERNVCVAPRIALGAVAPTVMRAPAAEAYLEGRAITDEVMAEAGRIAAGEARPISDFRASADYRRELIAVLTRRALANAYARAKAQREGEKR